MLTIIHIEQNVIEYETDTARMKRVMMAGVWFTYYYLPGTDLKSRLQYGGSGSAYYTYEPNRDLLTQVQNHINGGVVSQYDYVNDAAGRRTAITRSGSMMSETRTDGYGYNDRNELILAAKNTEVTEHQYSYDDIGNRMYSFDLGTNRAYTVNSLNQYIAIDDFVPQFDDDGNQTLIKTAIGVWQVTYNGENRPVLWECGETNIVMKFDRMGRRVEYIETVAGITNTHHRFVYDSYLCIQRLNAAANNSIDLVFGWDPSEPVATRPIVLQKYGQYNLFYTHDGNKNVSELVFFQQANGIAAHYEYAPFGAVTATSRSTPVTAYDFREYNPFRFSSEYADDALGLMYYNHRHYFQCLGQWTTRDPILERGGLNIYSFTHAPLYEIDINGLAKFLCIMSNCAGKHGASFAQGHAMLYYYETDSTDSKINSSTYGLWPDTHPDIIKAGLNNPTNSDVRINFHRDNPGGYKYCHCREIDDAMECKLKCVLKQNHSWRLTNNCASFASETFEEVTGIDIDADDLFGFETPREVGDSILRANGGSSSNVDAIPRAPNNIPSSHSGVSK